MLQDQYFYIQEILFIVGKGTAGIIVLWNLTDRKCLYCLIL